MVAAPFDRWQASLRAARRNGPGLLGWRMRRRYRFALRRMAGCAGARVLDVGGAQGIFGAMLLASGAAEVIVVEPQAERVEIGRRLQRHRRVRFEHADVLDRLDLLADVDAVTALHCLHQLGPRVHELFGAIEKSKVARVVLQGGVSHAHRVQPAQEHGLYGSALGLPQGMARLLERYGFRPMLHDHRRYPVVVGVRS
jgi:cyclopropane fatty-acyl-phospholipid synthase-like methyltransferase